MKTVLYAVRTEDNWQWHISLDFRVDRRFWPHRLGAPVSLLWFEPQLSFGQALQLKIALDAREWNRFTARQAAEAAVAQGHFHRLPEPVRRELAWNAAEFHAAPSSEEGGAVDGTELDRLLARLAGRLLGPEELQSLLGKSEAHPDNAQSCNTQTGHAQIGDVGAKDAVWKRYIQYAYLQGRLQWVNGVISRPKRMFGLIATGSEHRCSRCGSGRLHWTDCSNCGTLCPYCEDCLTMGRVRFCTPLVYSVERPERRPAREFGRNTAPGPPSAERILERWSLSPAQKEASAAGIRFLSSAADPKMKRGETVAGGFLIWAVTGAGKTEMIFPLIDFELERGGLVCVATPRRDVVLELKPRIEKVFPDRSVVTLYGGSEQRWEQGEVTIATTHQLLRFRHRFDLVIIDELDAFPYHNNPMLEYAAARACKPEGRYIFLSATPPRHLVNAARIGKLPHVKVPVRFHRHPLPVPVCIKIKPLDKLLALNRLPQNLQTAIRASLERGAQLFVFVPAIRLVEPLVKLLERSFPSVPIEGTSSRDAERTSKVQRFRDGAIRLLVTTTILERGVTVPKTDVFILDADSALFDEAALVQMSGRAGRSKDDPAGRVFFAAPVKTASQLRAIRQIRAMNRLARRKGFLAT